MAINPNLPAPFEFPLQVERFYAALISAVDADFVPHAEPGLGGKLLYAGELDAEARALLVAANIAGAGSLAATADAAAQKQAIRDGVVDFLVTSLDEALRILKNEIRKRETVAVCVALAPETPEADFAREMLERGVLPDLVRPGAAGSAEGTGFLRQGALRVETAAPGESLALLTWKVAAAPALWLPKLDAIALDSLSRDLSPAAFAARRWLRLAPRYLGRLGQGVRLLRCGEQTALRFLERVERAEFGIPVEIQLSRRGESVVYQFSPSADSDSAG